MPEASQDKHGTSRIVATVLSVLWSVLIHGSLLAAALYWMDETPGAISVPSDAVSLELMLSDVTEAIEVSATALAAASSTSVQSEVGTADREAPAVERPAETLVAHGPDEHLTTKEIPALEAVNGAPEGLKVLEGAQEVEEQTGQEQPRQAKAEHASRSAARRAPTGHPAKKPTPVPAQTAMSTSSSKGGARSKAAQGSAASSGRVSASTGSTINYAARVRARVAAHKPGGAGQRGTVVIAFGVTRSGAMSYASVSRSSGNPGLDRQVLAAVRGAGPFPTPPPGANLRFAIPFYFR